MSGSRLAVVLVTHNGERWLPQVLASILAQTRTPDTFIVVDDGSTDATTTILRDHGLDPIPARTRLGDPKARTGANFEQGVRHAMERGAQLVALGDQDDTWHRDRLAHQAWLMDETTTLAMLASDGRLVDEQGQPTTTGGDDRTPGQATLREAFPLPGGEDGWRRLSPAQRMTKALRSSVATGGASMIRPSVLHTALAVPPGWLHDRWWSLAALAMDAFRADDRIVLDYRLSSGQQVGLDAGTQQAGAADRLLAIAGSPLRLASRFEDVRSLRGIASPDVAPALTPWAVLTGFLGR